MQTGDLENAGTDCRVCLVLFGLNGTSAPIYLKKDEDTLERASMDIHQVNHCLLYLLISSLFF